MPGNPPVPSAVPGKNSGPSALARALIDVDGSLARRRARLGDAAERDDITQMLAAARAKLVAAIVAAKDADGLRLLPEREHTEAGTADAAAAIAKARRGPAPRITRGMRG